MKKTFDAVIEMRLIRDRLQREYDKNPELRSKRLGQIHKKYGIAVKGKEKVSAKRKLNTKKSLFY